ncbi:MAG: hypothetical protein M3O70_01535 [Actinomycetota bacterium]|nr:hypothetical protein [Actinomycetota bacterium]
MNPEPHPRHFTEWDRNNLISAGQILMAWAHDWAFHEAADDTWYRDVDDDVLETVAELDHILHRAQEALSQARRLYRAATSAARLRALNEQRRSRPAQEDDHDPGP